jgi:hypothetical protein
LEALLVDTRSVQVPVRGLLDPLTPAPLKVIWMALHHNPTAGPAELEARTGLSRPTILKGLRLVPAAPPGTLEEPAVPVPAALLAGRNVGPQAKVLYGILQATPDFQGRAGRVTYALLSSLTGRGLNTVKRAVSELTGAGWLQVSRANRLHPIQFTLVDPVEIRAEAEVSAARRRLRRAKFVGEALMQEYLSLLIDSDQFTDNARPGFLVNPLTEERLELDRYYPPDVAFEFNGTQHYAATGQFTQEEANAQHLRDLIKAGICLYRGIRLVIIHAEDLSAQGMLRKIGQQMPLRILAGKAPLIHFLDEAGKAYGAAFAGRTQPRL